MSTLQPKVQAIQNKYGNDKEKMNEKLAELYETENISPSAGCLPMIIQMILIFGLFQLLRNPLIYMGSSEEMLFAVHESFLWMIDLCQPDKWVLPIAAGIVTFFSYSMNMATSGQNNGMMNAMRFIFPVMIVFMGRTFPSGLAIYWFFSQVIQIFYNIRMRKIREKMALEAAKGGKR